MKNANDDTDRIPFIPDPSVKKMSVYDRCPQAADAVHDGITALWNKYNSRISPEEFSDILELWNQQHKDLCEST